jgi:acyl dehydratase
LGTRLDLGQESNGHVARSLQATSGTSLYHHRQAPRHFETLHFAVSSDIEAHPDQAHHLSGGASMTEKVAINTVAELKTWVGKEVAVGRWITVTQEMIDKFAEASGDYQWIHVDVERCSKESPFKTTIAHGNLTFCLLSSIARNADVDLPPSKMSVNYGSNKIRYTGIVPVGSKVRGRYKLLDVKDVDEKTLLVSWGVTGEIEGGTKPVLIAETLSRRSA